MTSKNITTGSSWFVDNRHYDVADPILRKAKRLMGGAISASNRNPKLKGDIDEGWILDKLKLGRCDATGLEFRFGEMEEDWPFEPCLLRAYSRDQVFGFNKSTTKIVCRLLKEHVTPLKQEQAEESARKIAGLLERSRNQPQASGLGEVL